MQYNRPPLVFMGNKKNMLNNIKQVLQDMQGDGYINDETIFLDVFGGFELIQRVSKPYIFFGSENSDIVESFEYFKAHNKELEGYAFNEAYLSVGGKDYILYPQGRSLFEK